MRKVIITCAVTGNAPFDPRHPSFPVTPQQIATASVEAARAGAAIVHIHVRDPRTALGSRDPKLFKETVDRVRDAGTDIVINLTGGLGAFLLPDPEDERRAIRPESDVASVDERMKHLELCRPDMASLDITTGNQVEGTREFVYLNTTRTLRSMARRFIALGIKPELELRRWRYRVWQGTPERRTVIAAATLPVRSRCQMGRARGSVDDPLHAEPAARQRTLGCARDRKTADARTCSVSCYGRSCAGRSGGQPILASR